MKNDNTKKCADLVQEKYQSRMDDIRTLYEAVDQKNEDLGSLYDYGLSIDRVPAGTFTGQRAPYSRYQLSYGGPSDEFRLYDNGDLEYWYMDWYDGAHVDVTGPDAAIIADIISMTDVTD